VNELRRAQELLVAAMQHRDPAAWLRGRLADPSLPLGEAARAQLAALDPDGLRLTQVVVEKLRFERLLRGDRALAAAFAADGEALVRRVRAYFAAVPRAQVFPEEEAAAFHAFERGRRDAAG
jgi:hypothetical protein